MAPERLRLGIEYVPTGSLRPYPKNSKRHPPEQIRLLVKSMEAVGFTAPILTNEYGVILAGHARWQAAKKMDMPEVPTVLLRGLTPDQQQAYVIADNRLSELGKADKDILSMELGELQEAGFDLEAVGYTPTDLEDLLGEGALPSDPPEDQDEEGPEVEGTVSCPCCGFVFPAKVDSVTKRGAKRKGSR